ncbi:hypothetical protein HII28_19515 [Planctomonas sp. JC2975]|uniref:hypothetical protein n=1 Tax=Planctomonas sp. JC2975 TaxID=2729626 RepID=UPI0014741AE9|nr:hypothetical protein [Planctomonas sp. JC2975]NNC14052.1 hypothetical protein [Planctomonas sp. JC2975]
MNVADIDFSLQWPQELFLWEAKRIAAMRASSSFTNMVVCLFAEAFVDGDVASSLEQLRQARGTSWFEETGAHLADAAEVLDAILKRPTLLHGYQPARYWLERRGRVTPDSHQKPLEKAFAELIEEMREVDYFPKVWAKGCVDDGISWGRSISDASADIGKAIHADVPWPLGKDPVGVPTDVLYAIIEYFHDQAQRPRTRSFHSYGDCGWHYDAHNKESGGVVYRWRVNELLERYNVDLRLGSKGSEKGRLIRHAGYKLDGLADELSEAPSDSDGQLVADAIQLYRARASTTTQRRAAVTQLANYLEKHRQAFKASEFAKGDESDLFNIFNNFAIRHGNGVQKGEYGDEYLDWIFWTTLSAIQLLKSITSRKPKP